MDKFTAIRELWSAFQNNLKKYYSVGSFVTVDEQLVGFRGKYERKKIQVPSTS